MQLSQEKEDRLSRNSFFIRHTNSFAKCRELNDIFCTASVLSVSAAPLLNKVSV